MNGRARTCLALALLASGCGEVPPVAYETDHFDVAPDFEHPVCAGTLAHFEEHLAFVESALARPVPHGERIRLYWITGDLDSWCSERAIGCYYPGTRVIVGAGESTSHEIVHAVLNAEAHTNLFLEEALAELYSGVAAYRPLSQLDSGPKPSDLLWLSVTDYRLGELDYSVGRHFIAFVYHHYGTAAVRGIADVVATGASPHEIEHAFERFTERTLAELEAEYLASRRSLYAGLEETKVPELEHEPKWVDVSLRCDEDTTMGPLWGADPGMFRVFRLVLDEPRRVDVGLMAPPDLSVDLIDVRRERGAGKVVDFFHPQTSGEVEHPRVQGGESASFLLSAGTHLVVVWRAGYDYSDAFLQIDVRDFPHQG